MYRIRSAQGTETVYDSLEEFSVAVKRGAVTPDDEIFHTRAGRWLDIKSHPHYRAALTWNGGNGTAAHVGAGVTPPASAPSRPTPSPAAPQAAQPRPQASDRPAPRPASPQTALRPQLQAAPAPGGSAAPQNSAQAYVPPQKSKELTFIDLNGSVTPPASQRNATIVEVPRPAPKPLARPTPAPVAKPKPESQASTPEADFLVMDGGIESPVRTSTGHRTVGDDLEVLFDAPLPDVESQRAAPKPPAPKDAAPKSVQSPKPSPAPLPAAGSTPAAAPVPTSAPKQVEKLAPAAQPVAASPAPASAPAAPAAAKPVTAARPAVAVEEDLDIPGGPLTAEASPVASAPTAPVAPSRPKLSLIAGGVGTLIVIAVMFLWQPWRGGATTTDAAAQSVPTDSDSAATSSGGAIPPAGYSGTVPATPAASSGIKPIATIGPTTAPRTDSAAEEPKDQIIAAARPNFRADAVISTADIGLSSNDRNAKPTAIAPSELARRAEVAERVAQQELAVRLGSAGFRSLLAPTRIGSAEGAASTRNAWIAGSDAIRQYRSRIGRIENAYEDSMLASQRAERWPAQELRAWGARQSLAEAGDVSQLADLMFSQITEALDLLAALNGQYEIKNGVIDFRSPGAESRYTSIRNWVEQRMQSWSATPESARPHTVTMILRALGDGLPAVK